MRVAKNAIPFTLSILFVLSSIAFFINYFVYHYPGNHYIPDDAPWIGIILILIYGGLFLLHGQKSKWTQLAKEFIYLFLIMITIGIATNAVQFTPFKPIDNQIIQIENALHINMNSLLAWVHANSWLKNSLDWIYSTLGIQMTYIPLLVILTGRLYLLREYYFLLLISTLLGFVFYYFFPTTAPASIINSEYFSGSQHATYLKFTQIHHHIAPTTLEGGLIALPSFHVIWAWLCCYLVREWRLLFFCLIVFNSCLALSCVLLGWHYVTDIIGGFMVIFIAHTLIEYKPQKKYHELQS